MSSGNVSADRKTITFEINENRVVGSFVLSHLDSDQLNPDRIYMSMHTQSAFGVGSSSSNHTSVIIHKRNTKVLSHFFRHMADVMDEWYKEEDE